MTLSTNKTSSIILFFIITLLLLSTGAVAEEREKERWVAKDGHEAAPVDRANRIIKWCKDQGQGTRFASANLKIKGYHPCGKLDVMASCGADGRRFIGSSTNAPRGYLDCTRGPRIYIKRHEDGMIYSSDGNNVDLDEISHSDTPETEQIESNGDVKPLTRAERAKLKKEFEALSQNQTTQMVQNFLPLIEAFRRAEGQTSKSGKKYTYPNKDLLKHLDPQSEKILKDVLGPNYKRRMHKLFHQSRLFKP